MERARCILSSFRDDSLSSQANRKPLHAFTGSSTASPSFSPTSSRRSLMKRAHHIVSSLRLRLFPDSSIPESNLAMKPAVLKAYNSVKIYDSIEADKWIENNYHRWHLIFTETGNMMGRRDTCSRSAGFGLESLELDPSTLINMPKGADSAAGRVKGPIACMLDYNNPALCLFGESMSDTMAGMARQLAEISAFPVIIRPLSEYPSGLVELA
jgi:hypothetical protein